jgi:DNA anti-recombination protein RmuC
LDNLLGPNSSSSLNDRLLTIQEILQLGQRQIEDKVRETEIAVDGLYAKMEKEYNHLSHELKGLANVESVLLDTGDSVLDTKRRLEYGVQQIMGEVNNQLTIHTGNLNASLQQRFDGLATAVLGNQSIALTNLTSRMEEEISQVWRQIGILYHQMSKSANILDEIHSQTSQYVNNSMDTMSSMDGKVGQITNQMGEVDDNLNYLLGRMSLVVQEFNMIKGGLGDALVNLKQSFEEIGGVERKPDIENDENINDNPAAPETPNEV